MSQPNPATESIEELIESLKQLTETGNAWRVRDLILRLVDRTPEGPERVPLIGNLLGNPKILDVMKEMARYGGSPMVCDLILGLVDRTPEGPERAALVTDVLANKGIRDAVGNQAGDLAHGLIWFLSRAEGEKRILVRGASVQHPDDYEFDIIDVTPPRDGPNFTEPVEGADAGSPVGDRNVLVVAGCFAGSPRDWDARWRVGTKQTSRGIPRAHLAQIFMDRARRAINETPQNLPLAKALVQAAWTMREGGLHNRTAAQNLRRVATEQAHPDHSRPVPA